LDVDANCVCDPSVHAKEYINFAASGKRARDGDVDLIESRQSLRASKTDRRILAADLDADVVERAASANACSEQQQEDLFINIRSPPAGLRSVVIRQ
jgi:hypothetical protein